MQSEPGNSAVPVEVLLDGLPVQLAPRKRSIPAIRFLLETMAMEQQRILCSLTIDGQMVDLTQPVIGPKNFAHIEGETMGLEQVPLQLLRTAMVQAQQVRAAASSAVTLVLINEKASAQELWWDLSRELKQPLLTLSLMPEAISGVALNGNTSLLQLRKWQLQQLASIMKDVDTACDATDPAAISNALEYRVLPWLDGLLSSLELWQSTLLSRLTDGSGAPEATKASAPAPAKGSDK